jgi:predicted dehydrogenase
VFAKYGDVDTAVAALRLCSGVLVVMTVGRHDPRGYDIRNELLGPKDSISVGLGPRQVLRFEEPGVAPEPKHPAWPDVLARFAQAYQDEMHGFFRLDPLCLHGARRRRVRAHRRSRHHSPRRTPYGATRRESREAKEVTLRTAQRA